MRTREKIAFPHLIHSGLQTAKYLSRLTARVVKTEPTLATCVSPYRKGRQNW